MRKCCNVLVLLTILAVVAPGARGEPIAFPSIEVTSLEHSYVLDGKGYGTIDDWLSTGDGVGSAILTPFTTDLSTADSTISISIAAPAGKRFVFTMPSNATHANLYAWLSWRSGGPAPVTFIWMPNFTFEGLSGTAPTVPSWWTWGGYFGVDFINADLTLPDIRESFAFTALRIDFDVPPGGLSSCSKLYEVGGVYFDAYVVGPGLPDQTVLSIEDIGTPTDTTPPTIAIATPGPEATYLLNEVAAADWAVTDNVSQGEEISIVAATAPNGQPIDTSSVGTKTFTVTAQDAAGNQATQTVTYRVLYGFGGFLPPIDPAGPSAFRARSTIPVKFKLLDGAPSPLSVGTATATISVAWVDNTPEGTAIVASTDAGTDGNLFRYDPVDELYIFNLSTERWGMTPGTWKISVRLDDGTAHSVSVGIK